MKHKYIINNQVQYFTRGELKSYYIDLLNCQGFSVEDDVMEIIINNLLIRIAIYDGDPYGNLKQSNRKLWRFYHQMEAHNFLQVLADSDMQAGESHV